MEHLFQTFKPFPSDSKIYEEADIEKYFGAPFQMSPPMALVSLNEIHQS